MAGGTKPGRTLDVRPVAEGHLRTRQRSAMKQADLVAQLLAGRRVLYVAPTGHGKSLCYQGLARSPWSRGVVLVFQPLKALMQEQVERARALGLRAELVNSDQEQDEQREILERRCRR